MNTDTADITLNLTNENDNAPVIDDATVNNVSESIANGTEVYDVQEARTGNDTDLDGEALQYTFVHSNNTRSTTSEDGAFSIDPATGKITVLDTTKVDYESATSIVLKVETTDGVNTDTADITLNLTNENDNAPVIDDATVNNVSESIANGTEVYDVQEARTGNDTDLDGEALQYTFVHSDNTRSTTSEDGAFSIDPATGKITVLDTTKVDYESATSIVLKVETTDGVNTDTADITLNLTNENDNAPVIDDATVNNVSESIANGTEVYDVQEARTGNDTDLDGEALQYTFVHSDNTRSTTSEDGAFSIDPATGKITVLDTTKVDYESATSIVLKVETTDGVNTDTADIRLNLTNENDNAPVIDDATVNNVSESIANGTEVYDVQEARTGDDTDLDGEDLQYTFVHSDNTRSTTSEDGAFSIDPATGKITVLDTTKVDYESATSIVLKVETTDGVNTDTADITLNLTNENDNAPVIDDATVNNVSESIANGTEVYDVQEARTGNDTDLDGEALQYTFVHSDNTRSTTSEDGAFSIDPATGKITVLDTTKVDYESATSIVLKVETTDGVNTDTADITLNLTNENDNAPVINDATVNNVSESIANGTEVYDVQEARTGDDTDLDGEDLQYTFVHSNNTRSTTSEDGAFSIDPATGKITVLDTTKVDYESATSIVLKVETTDGVNTDTADITLNLTNENDNDTVFTKESEKFEYSEGTAAGVTLGTVTATDADGASIEYSIAQEHNVYAADDVNKEHPFYQVDANGNVSLTEAGAKAFTNDYESGLNTHTITVTATGKDGSGEDTTDTIVVTLNETNVDEALSISGLNGANAELTVHESNLSDGSSPDKSALSKVGSFSFTSIDGLASLVIAGHSFNVTELLALNSSDATISTPYGELTLTGFSGDLTGGTIQYEYTLNENVDNDSATNANGADYTDHISVTVIDVDGSQVTDSLDVKIVDDVSTALNDNGEVDIVVDSFTVSGVVANWTSWSNGTNVTTFDGTNAPNGGGLDNDSGKDQIRWGQPASSYSSGYGFIDNDSALNGEFALNQDIILGTFTHYNYPVYSGGAITSASMDVAFSVTDAHGVLTPVTLKLNFDHNETPNTNDPEASKDIIKVGNTNVTFENAGALYTLQVIGFRIPGTNQIVTEIRTGENATNSYELVVRVGPGEGYELPSTSGNVLANDVSGADVDMTVVGAASGNHVSSGVSGSVGSMIAGLYGNLILLADGSYTYQVTANASSIPNDAIETFTYTMKDGDGDTSTALLSINVNRVTMADFNANQDHKVGLEDSEVAGNVLANDGSKNTSVDHFTVGNDATSHAVGSPVSLEQGELTLNSDGSYTFKPADNWNGEVPVITYTTNTGKTSTLAITITPVDDATVTQPDHKSISEDTIATGNVLANDSDIDSTLSVTSFHVEGVNGVYTAGNTMYQLAEGTLVLKANGDYTFDPKDNWSGSLPEITYTTNTGATGTLNIHVEAVADAPNLTINGYTSVAAINFEDARLNGSWDGVVANQIHGLNTIGTWYTSNNSGKVEIGYENIYVSGGSSTNKVMEIEFNNGDKTLYTNIHAQAGRFYELEFDIAARAGSVNSSGLTIKLVPLNAYGVPIMAEAITLYDFNPTNADWLKDQKVTLPIDQTGEYRLLFEGDNADSYGAILDNLAFKVVDNMGYRGDFIKLSEISTSLNDTDTSETLSLKLKGMPEGSILKDEQGHEATVGSNGEVDITGWDYSSLQIKTPSHGNFNITVEATATESSNQDSATTSATIPVTVLHPNEYVGRGGVDSFLLTKTHGDNANLNIALNAYYEGTTAIAPVTQQVAVTIDTDLVIHSGDSNDYIDLGISRADNTVYTGSSIPNFNNSTPSQSTLADSAFMKNDVITDHDGVLLQSVQSQIQPITDTVNLGSGNDTVYGGGGNLAAYGGAGNDTLIGGDGNDALRGGADNDYLSGGRGNDVLRGDSGNDVLVGGLGSDILTGGSGEDLFKWVDGDLDNSKDRITDFTIGQDKIDLSDLFSDETRTLDQLLNSHVIEITDKGQNSEIVINKGSTEHVTIQLDGVAASDLLSNLENIIHIKD
nr:choice-of-anchor K domain-containing protein [Vibrio metoecus]